MKWISVKDQIPPSDKSFLGFLDNGEIHVFKKDYDEYYSAGGWESCNYCGGQSLAIVDAKDSLFVKRIISHWAPLPKPPKD